MAVRFEITDNGYALLTPVDGQWTKFAALAGGARALLPAARSVDEGALERAIEVAEDWLMPHATRLRGEILEVSDPSGRLKAALEARLSVVPDVWSVTDIEALFLRLVDLATGRKSPRDTPEWLLFMADVTMLRELAHHGQVAALQVL
jgi:hypothetical protein